MSIKVLLVDDDELIKSSLQIILNLKSGISVVHTCSNGDEAYSYLLMNNGIDVILMDIRMPVCDGVMATKKITSLHPEMKIIILTTFDDDEYIFEALKNGAKGYLLKNVSPDKIEEAIRIVHNGSMLIHNPIAEKLSGMLHKDNEFKPESYGLIPIEHEIVKLISDGLSNKEIAEKVYLSEGTVKNKITDILSKLSLRDRTQIAIFYLKQGRV